MLSPVKSIRKQGVKLGLRYSIWPPLFPPVWNQVRKGVATDSEQVTTNVLDAPWPTLNGSILVINKLSPIPSILSLNAKFTYGSLRCPEGALVDRIIFASCIAFKWKLLNFEPTRLAMLPPPLPLAVFESCATGCTLTTPRA